MNVNLTIPQMPFSPSIILYLTFDVRLVTERFCDPDEVVITAYRLAVAKVYGESYLKLAHIEPEMQCGLLDVGKTRPYRATISCPSFDFCIVLDQEIRTILKKMEVKNEHVFTCSQLHDNKNEKRFFSESWDGCLEKV